MYGLLDIKGDGAGAAFGLAGKFDCAGKEEGKPGWPKFGPLTFGPGKFAGGEFEMVDVGELTGGELGIPEADFNAGATNTP